MCTCLLASDCVCASVLLFDMWVYSSLCFYAFTYARWVLVALLCYDISLLDCLCSACFSDRVCYCLSVFLYSLFVMRLCVMLVFSCLLVLSFTGLRVLRLLCFTGSVIVRVLCYRFVVVCMVVVLSLCC